MPAIAGQGLNTPEETHYRKQRRQTATVLGSETSVLRLLRIATSSYGGPRDTGHPSIFRPIARSRVWIPASSTRNQLAKIRVQIFYKRPEIPANTVVLAIAFSVTWRKHEKAENPGLTPVSATKSFTISVLPISVQRLESKSQKNVTADHRRSHRG